MRPRFIDFQRAAFMAACALVFSAELTYAQLPSIRVNGPFSPQPAEPSVFEGSLGGAISTLNFTVELSAVPTQDVSVLFSTFTLNSPGGNAVSGASCANANTLNGTDFIGIVNQAVLIPANTDPPLKTVPVTVCRDNQIEFHQNFAQQTREDVGVILSNPVNAVCSGSECFGFGHIFDDDAAPFASINSVTTREPVSGSRTATFTVTLSHPHPGFEVRVGWATRNGTARGGAICAPFITGGYADYRIGSGTLVFPPETTSQTIPITICSDPVDEDTQTYFVDLTNQGNASVFSPGTGSILDFQLLFTGTPTLVPDNAEVGAEEWLTYHFGWIVTNGVWRDLKSLDLRLRDPDSGKIPLWIRWLETGNTFQVCEVPGHSDDEGDATHVKCGAPVVAGSSQALNAPLASLDMAGTKATGTGPLGPGVTLDLLVSFKRGAATGTYDVEVASETDAGLRDDFAPAGVLTIKR